MNASPAPAGVVPQGTGKTAIRPAPDAARNEWWIRSAGFAISAAIVCTFTYRTLGYRMDDALIYARYARNFLSGAGLVYNRGEIHNAITSPLFMWLLIAAGWAGFDIPTAANVLGGLCTLATVGLLIFALFPRDYPPFVGVAAGLLYATANLTYATFGLESPLLILLLTAMLAAYRLKQWTLFAAIAGLAVMTRGEAVLLAAPLYVAVWWQTKRLPWRLALLSIAVGLPFLLYNQLFYGHLLADTLSAKVAQGRSGLWGTRWVFVEFGKFVLGEMYIGWPMVMVLAGMSALPLLAGRRGWPVWWVGGFVGVLMLFYGLLPVPAYHWYLLPLIWAFCVLAPLGVACAYHWTVRRQTAAGFAVLALGIVALSAALYAHGKKLVGLQAGPITPYCRVAAWLNAHAPGRSVGAAEVGHLGWFTELYIVDMVGLVSPGNAEYIRRADVESWMDRYHPEYILIHDPPWRMEKGAARALQHGRYRRVPGIVEPGFTLMGPPVSRLATPSRPHSRA